MTEDLSFQCRCGDVKGRLTDVAPGRGTRLVCYCDDCQAFMYFLGRESDFLDAQGGSDIFQTSPHRLTINEGADRISVVQLTEGGVYRWHAGCCKTPLANTTHTATLPFVGTYARIYDAANREALLGPTRGAVFSNYARGDGGLKDRGKLWMMGSILLRMAGARLSGAYRRNPFFDAAGDPVAAPRRLTSQERAAIDARMAADR